MDMLTSLAVLMLSGMVMTFVCKKLHLPNVTGYLVAGLIAGPSFLNIMTSEMLEGMKIVTTIALAFIAFSIGGEFKLSNIKKIGSSATTITMWQGLMAVALVTGALIIFGYPIPMALTLGAISAATAPAATLMVVRQYKAKGPVTSTLLPVVAMDDAVCLMIFSLFSTIAVSMSMGSEMTIMSVVVEPVLEIVLSLLVGAVIGIVMAYCVKIFPSGTNRLNLTITAVVIGAAAAEMFHLSSLLLCMSIGAMLINLSRDAEKILNKCDDWTPPVHMLFFLVSGAELDLAVLPAVGLIGVIYLIARSLGKYFGAYMGAVMVKADPNIKKYLGITLLPQAGVAIGLAQIAMTDLPAYGAQIRAVVLCATLVYELVGPLLTKIALQAAGEIRKEN